LGNKWKPGGNSRREERLEKTPSFNAVRSLPEIDLMNNNGVLKN